MTQNTQENFFGEERAKRTPEKMDSVLTVEKETTKFTESLNRLSNLVVSFIKDVSENTESVDLDQPIPDNSDEIKLVLDSLKQKNENLEAILKQYQEILQNIVQEIETFKITTLGDLQKLDSLISSATKTILQIKKSELERKSAESLFNTTKQRFFETTCEETGFNSPSEIDEQCDLLTKDIRSQKKEFLGLGGLIHRKKITQLQQERRELRQIRFQPSLDRIYYGDYQDNRLTEIEEQITKNLVSKIRDTSDLAMAEIEKSEQASTLELSPALIAELNDSYLNKVVRPELAEHLKEARKYGNVSRDYGTKKEREQALAILADGFNINMNFHSWSEPEEKRQKREEINKQLSELPSQLQTYIKNIIGQNQGNSVWGKFNENVHTIERDQYLKRLKKTLQTIKQTCLKANDPKLRAVKYDLADHNFPAFKTAGQFTEESLTNFDVARWEVFRANKSLEANYGSETLAQCQKMFEGEILNTLCEANNSGNDYALASKLIELRSIEATPFIFLDAFRISGDGGGHHLITAHWNGDSSQTKLYEFVASLKPEEIKKLKAKNIPGLLEIIEIIIQNKDNFSLEELRLVDKDVYTFSPNLVFGKIQAELEKMACFYLENGDDQEKKFILRTIKDLRLPLGAQADFIRNMLAKENTDTDFEVRGQANQTLLWRFKYYCGDFESLAILVESDSLWVSYIKEILEEIAFNWSKIKDTFTNENPNKVESIKTHLKLKIEEIIKNSKLTITDKYAAYVAAHNLQLEIIPSQNEMIDFFRSADLEQTDNSQTALSYIINLAEGIVFSDDQISKIIRIILDKHLNNYMSDKDQGILYNFINGLPINKEYGLEDKEALLSLPEFFKKNKLKEILLDPNIKITEKNWVTMLGTYILSEGGQFQLEEAEQKIIKLLFSAEQPENRNLCLNKLQKLWAEYLGDENNIMPVKANIICTAVRRTNDKAGDLKYISALTNIMNLIGGLEETKKTTPKTKKGISRGLGKQEKLMADRHWDENEKAVFYNISSNIIAAAPSLYTTFLDLFEIMSGKEIEIFSKEIYPFYQINLIILERNNKSAFSGRDLIPMRKRLEMMREDLSKADANISDILEKEKAEVIKSIQQTFEKRFGLLKIPENLTEEHLRTLQNCTRYLGNINSRDQIKEALISFYLGLNLNDEWENFRMGSEINLPEYFHEDVLNILGPILEKRKELNKIQPDIIGLSLEDTVKFQKSIQEETISNMIGNVQTVDIKLGNAKRNLESLTDPDVYPDKVDYKILTLIKNAGKIVGVTLAKTYAETIGKKVIFSEDEIAIRKSLEAILKSNDWTPTTVKETQDRLKVPNLICSVLRKLDEEKVEEVINDLQITLTPTEEIIEIFNSFGEEFKVNSGALALSQDLSYLENILVKNEKKLSTEQKKTLSDYLNKIRAQMSVLESVYTRVKEYFEKIKKGAHIVKNEILNDRLKEIEKVLYQSVDSTPIISRVTNNLNLIIENMRECLGCRSKQINNDTNLTFGDFNKFYILSQGKQEANSLADEIVFFAPIKMTTGNQEMSFVLDRIYGSKSSDVLLAHIKAVTKKYSSLKKSFPSAKISILVTDSALSSVGFSREQAEVKIKEILDEITISPLEDIAVNVTESALGDHYVEFGGSIGRYKGEITTSGLRIAS